MRGQSGNVATGCRPAALPASMPEDHEDRSKETHAAPPGHRHPRTQGARRALAFPPRRRRRRAAPSGGSPGRCAGRAGHGRAGELQRPARRRRALRDHVGDVWYQRTVRVPRGWAASGSSCTSSRPRTGPRCGSATRRWSGTRAATRRSRPTSPRSSRRGRSRAGHRLRRQHAELPDHPARRRRADAGGPKQRYWHDFYNYAGLHRTVWLACTPAGPDRGHHRRHRPRRHAPARSTTASRPPAPTGSTCASCCATPPAREVGTGDRRGRRG